MKEEEPLVEKWKERPILLSNRKSVEEDLRKLLDDEIEKYNKIKATAKNNTTKLTAMAYVSAFSELKRKIFGDEG